MNPVVLPGCGDEDVKVDVDSDENLDGGDSKHQASMQESKKTKTVTKNDTFFRLRLIVHVLIIIVGFRCIALRCDAIRCVAMRWMKLIG